MAPDHNNNQPPTRSRTVNWIPVHLFVTKLLAPINGWPLLGTLDWQDLEDDDPIKLAAVIDGGQHWALQLEMNQEALAEASKAVSASADWRAIATELQKLDGARKSGKRIERRPA